MAQRAAPVSVEPPANNGRPVKCFTPAHGPQQLVRVSPKVVAEPAPRKPAPVVAVAFPNEEVLEQSEFPMDDVYPVMRRRRGKMRRFLRMEIPVTVLGLSSALLALTHTITQPWQLVIINVITIGCAFAAAVIPICFFALTPTLPGVNE